MCTLHRAAGFQKECAPAATIESDVFGHFETKARTGPAIKPDISPAWRDSTFEIDLDGSSELHILLYEPKNLTQKELLNSVDNSTEILICKGKINILTIEELKKNFKSTKMVPQKKTFPLSNEITIDITFEFQPRECLLRRTQSRKRGGTFGKKLEHVCTRDSRGTGEQVPHLVKKCISEVERRGLKIQGIYRQNGPAQKLQLIRSSFESGKKSQAERMLNQVDIHCVTGLLKLYLRQLPEPLFTDVLYRDFIKAIQISGEEEKCKRMVQLIEDLKNNYVCNYETLTRLVQHFGLREFLIKKSNFLSDFHGNT